QGTLMLMGVSEKEVPYNTRMVLEKGLTLVGCSRSDRPDFENVVAFLRAPGMAQRVARMISEVVEVRSIDDIYKAFDRDLTTPFKTVLHWNL
ncbi:MAG: ribitol-5-phosphate dehydrogenase, partial [Clostridia bacterium]|nr:ribitol-5-phosphate dehydrogenase [Clostridia bacterium]